MSVFRNNPRQNDPDSGARFVDPPARPEPVDLLNQDASRESARAASTPAPDAPAPSSSSFTPFSEREARAMPTEADKCANVIAAGSKWNGSLNIDDSVRIEGQLSGEVNAKGTVHISEGARVDAKIKAAFVVVSGAFKGEVRCSERLELMPKSRIEGQIVTKVLNVHEGAVVDGTIQMTEREAARSKENGNGAESTESQPRSRTASTN
ncbi:MAG: hypothetical protein GEU75_08345 [Dehalococcoidia bacterium]|nr:hypothetical protein [Dehalococcoidia bacterium]